MLNRFAFRYLAEQREVKTSLTLNAQFSVLLRRNIANGENSLRVEEKKRIKFSQYLRRSTTTYLWTFRDRHSFLPWWFDDPRALILHRLIFIRKQWQDNESQNTLPQHPTDYK